MKTNLENYEERFVDYMEGLLDASEMREVEAFVAEHPELAEDFKLFCSTKLVPDTSVVYTKKESLRHSTPVIRPLFVRIVAAAACVALLIGIGVRFLKPHHELEKQPMLAGLTPIEAQPLEIQKETQGLRKSNTKPVVLPQTVSEIQEEVVLASIELIASVSPIQPESIQWRDDVELFDVETTMFIELGARLASVVPISEPSPFIEDVINEQKEQAVATLNNTLFSNVRHTTKSLYKRTAKTVMDVYYTADYRINERKDLVMATR